MTKLQFIVQSLVVATLFAACECGPGSYITIINETPYDFLRIDHRSFQMDDWEFPWRIDSRTRRKVYYEYCANFFTDWRQDVGHVRYNLSSTDLYFEISAVHNQTGDHYPLRRNWPGIFVRFNDFSNLGSEDFDLIWVIDGNVDFDLSGSVGNFRSKAVEAYIARPYKAPKNWNW